MNETIDKTKDTTTPADWKAGGAYYEHRGHAIFYRQAGTGPDLVLLHGFPTSSYDWKYLWPALSARYRVIAPDFIGYGFSAKPARYDYSIHDQADLTEGLLHAAGVRRALLFVHDYGVSVAQELLARCEDRRRTGKAGLDVVSVCFLNGGLFPESHRPRFIQKLLLSPLGPLVGMLLNEKAFRKNFTAVFGPDTQPDDRELREFWELIALNGGPRVYHKLIGYIEDRRLHRERWVGVLRETRRYLRVVNGPLDPVSGQHLVERYRELVPNPDVVSLPGIGHYPLTEDPNGTLQAFLEFAEGRGAP